MIDDNEIGAWSYYFNKIAEFHVNQCSDGLMTEEDLENILDKLESMVTVELKLVYERMVKNGVC